MLCPDWNGRAARDGREASSAESVGDVRFWEGTEGVVEGNFKGVVLAETVGVSEYHFGFVVEALDDAGRQSALGGEPVEEEYAVVAECADDFLDGRKSRAHRDSAPVIEEFPSDGGTYVLPRSAGTPLAAGTHARCGGCSGAAR